MFRQLIIVAGASAASAASDASAASVAAPTTSGALCGAPAAILDRELFSGEMELRKDREDGRID